MEVCALIGDIVGSRRLPDRRQAQQALQQVLAEVNAQVPSAQPLEATVGDEFQGAYDTVADATMAGLLVRLDLLPAVDVRIGLGVGVVEVIDGDRRPLLQDGPGWWAAREALDQLGEPRVTARTAYLGPESDLVTAFLLVRDALVDRLGDRGRSLLGGALRGLSQKELAAREGIGRPAVSQQFARGVSAVRQAQLRFAATARWPSGEEPPR